MIRQGRRNRPYCAIHLNPDILVADQPQVKLSMSPERECELGRPDRVERNEALLQSILNPFELSECALHQERLVLQQRLARFDGLVVVT